MGHMREVKAALVVDERELAERRQLVEQINDRRAREPFFAEPKPDASPQWHVVTTHPAAENTAAAHLAARRFGLYLPTFLDTRPGHRTLRRPIFPGYVFLFVWDIRAHWDRIRSAPGVAGIVVDREEHAAVLPDAWVRMVQGYEIKRMTVDELGAVSWRKKPRQRPRKARLQRWQAAVGAQEPVDNQVTVSCYSAMEQVVQLDDSARVGVLRQALGLPLHTS